MTQPPSSRGGGRSLPAGAGVREEGGGSGAGPRQVRCSGAKEEARGRREGDREREKG